MHSACRLTSHGRGVGSSDLDITFSLLLFQIFPCLDCDSVVNRIADTCSSKF